MTINEGTWDRAIRVVIGLTLWYVAWTAWPAEASLLFGAGMVSLVLLVIGTVAFVTGVVGWCALYKVLGVSTNKRVSV